MPGQSVLCGKFDVTQLASKAAIVGGRQFVHCEGDVGEGFLDGGGTAMGYAAAMREAKARHLAR